MTIRISDQSDRILEDAVNNGQFRNKEEAISEAIRLFGENASEESRNCLTGSAWRERFRQHMSDTPRTTAHFIDDSRESIYEGRGL